MITIPSIKFIILGNPLDSWSVYLNSSHIERKKNPFTILAGMIVYYVHLEAITLNG